VGTIWVREFTGGLDTRRMNETTQGGVLIVADDGHINRGGEFEKRAAFVPVYQLPAGKTVGLAAPPSGLVVFGSKSGADAGAMPTGITYQQLANPDGTTALAKVLSYDLYRGKIYAVARFTNGVRLHYFDGVLVTDWADGRAATGFAVLGGTISAGATATGSFEILSGSAGAGNQITNIAVAGQSIIGAPVAHTGNNATTATAVAAAINAYTSSPDYAATAVGAIVRVTTATPTAAVNGQTGNPTLGGDVTVGNGTAFSGGVNPYTSQVSDITVNGVSIINHPVLWTGSPDTTADAIVTAINAYVSPPDYEASRVGNTVNIAAIDSGAAANGYSVVVTADLDMSVSPATMTLSGGADLGSAFEPGAFVQTLGSKIYALSGPDLHFSGIQEPTHWNTDYIGAGFIDMSTYSSGSEELIALAKYQKYIAIFSDRVVQVWYVDSDPTQNSQVQLLNNTGTSCPRSVAQVGDNDLFYLDESGLRSMRARDASNAAATNDLGVPVDSLVQAVLSGFGSDARENVISIIEPVDGRFWLIMGSEIFVFSQFVSAKVSAWSRYNAGFTITDAVVFQRKLYVRAGDTIYCYGGLGNTLTYDATVAKAWLPYLDANKPTMRKPFTGIDAAAEGNWSVSAAFDPTNLEAVELIANIKRTTYLAGRIEMRGESTHCSPRFETFGTGPAKLGAVVLHYEGEDDEG
jgi:hypothetical protein